MCQVFLTADERVRTEHVGGVAVLYWRDMLEMAVEQRETYVAERLRSALARYQLEFGGGAAPAEWELVQGLDQVVSLCKEQGNRVEIGYMAGLSALRSASPFVLRARTQPWKVRQIQGTRTSERWILGEEFARVICEKETSDLEAGHRSLNRQSSQRAKLPESEARLPFVLAVDQCRNFGAKVRIGFDGGLSRMATTPTSTITKRLYKWRWSDREYSSKSTNQWPSGDTWLAQLAAMNVIEAETKDFPPQP